MNSLWWWQNQRAPARGKGGTVRSFAAFLLMQVFNVALERSDGIRIYENTWTDYRPVGDGPDDRFLLGNPTLSRFVSDKTHFCAKRKVQKICKSRRDNTPTSHVPCHQKPPARNITVRYIIYNWGTMFTGLVATIALALAAGVNGRGLPLHRETQQEAGMSPLLHM